MKQLVSINGYETIIEIPDGQEQCAVKYEGDKTSYRIDYGNSLVKVGGTVRITTSAINNVTTNTEGTKTIKFPVEFSKLLNVNVVALDTSEGRVMEHAHVGSLTNTGLVIYASALGAKPVTFEVMWSAEGVI